MTVHVAGQRFKSVQAAAASMGIEPGRFIYMRNAGRLDLENGKVLAPEDAKPHTGGITPTPYIEDDRCALHLMPYDLAVADLQEMWTMIGKGWGDTTIAMTFLGVPAEVISRVRELSVGDLVSFARPPWPQLGRVAAINGALSVAV